MAEEDIRVGLIGAGGNVRNRHIPGFRKVERLQILGVVNRSPESSHRVAEQFDIPRIYHTWQDRVRRESGDVGMSKDHRVYRYPMSLWG